MKILASLLRIISLTLILPLLACNAHNPPHAPPEHTINTNPPKFGAYTHSGIWSGINPILELESNLGRRLDSVHWYMNWTHAWDANLLEPLKGTGRAPLISWQSHTQSTTDIAAGVYDEYIRSWAVGVKEYGELVYLRPFPEMNGDWTGWNGNPDALVAAWQRITSIFEAEGARNARWVWSPNITDEPRTQENRMENYYPGAEHVDVLGLDGFNWGDTRPSIGWRTYESVFQTAYDRITTLGNQPVWFAEIGSAESGGNKADWINSILTSTLFPKLEMIVWFNEFKETDWTINSSPHTLAAIQTYAQTLNTIQAQQQTTPNNLKPKKGGT